jgi:uncharacterized protein involved in exopolysaccharide biosynthesis
MKSSFSYDVPSNGDIDLRDVISVLWSRKVLLLFSSVVAGVTAMLFTMTMPDMYRSDALLASADDSNGGGFAALSGQLGGLASLAGLSLGKVDTDKIQLAVEVMRSRAFLIDFINRRDILVPLMASKEWNSETGDLVVDSDVFDPTEGRWGEQDGDGPPSNLRAYSEISKILKISQSKETGLVKVSVDHVSPFLARQWVQWLIEDVNEQMKQRDIAEAQKSIEYLKEQLTETSIAGMQQVFYQLIEKQMQTIVLANVRDQYVFKIVDPPMVPEEKAGPKRAMIALLASVVGMIVAMGLVVLVYIGRRSQMNSKVD